MILSTASPKSNLVARIWTKDNLVLARLPERDEMFSKQAKKYGLEWNPDRRAWIRTLNIELNGKPEDRAAELAGRFMEGGFSVDVDEPIGNAVQSADWQPEQRRWVLAIGGKFHLRWRGQDDDLYWRAKSLPGAEYDPDSKAVSVPAMYYAEVDGFANKHEFQYSAQANQLAWQSARDYARIILPEIPKPEKPKTSRKIKERNCNLDKFRDFPRHSITLKTSLLPHQIPAIEKVGPMTVGDVLLQLYVLFVAGRDG